jgi:hypothetical protein
LLRGSRQSSEAKRVDNAQMLPKQLVKPGIKVHLQGLSANPALNGQTVTIAKFLEDGNRNRVKPSSVEAADATSTKAVSSLPVHNRVKPSSVEAADATSTKAVSSLPVHKRNVSTTAHATRRPGMPPKTSSQRSDDAIPSVVVKGEETGVPNVKK